MGRIAVTSDSRPRTVTSNWTRSPTLAFSTTAGAALKLMVMAGQPTPGIGPWSMVTDPAAASTAVITPDPTAASSPATTYERWDGQSVHAFEGTYGDYLLSKVSKVFPSLSSLSESFESLFLSSEKTSEEKEEEGTKN